MKIYKYLARLKYAIEHPKCKRCGKELYIPQPPEKLQKAWGIFAWTAFVKQYAKHHGWYELENLNRNLVCHDCIHPSDIPNTIMLDCYDKWIDKYKKWRNDNPELLNEKNDGRGREDKNTSIL